MKTFRVLVADDEAPIRRILERICKSMEWEVDCAEDGDAALALMQEKEYEIFTVDVNMPGPSGLELSRKILERYEAPAILILTGYAEVKQAVEAVKEGVYNYIQKDEVEINDIKEFLIQAAGYHQKLKFSLQARKQRESEMKDVQAVGKQFQAVFDLSADMILLVAIHSMDITDCNHAACVNLQYSRAQLRNMKITRLLPALTPVIVQQIRSTDQTGHVKEASIQNKEGKTIPIDISYTHVCSPNGEFVSILMRDITERKRMEAQIIHERNLLHLLMDNIPDSIYFKDHQLRYTAINKAFAARLNLATPEQAIGKTDMDLLSQSDAKHIHEEDQAILQTQQPLINKVNEFLFPDGSKKWYTGTKVPIVEPDGEVQGLIGISRDISSIKNSEQKLLKTTQELEGLFIELESIMSGLPIGVFLTDESFRITQVNAWIEQLLQVPKELLVGTPIADSFDEYFQSSIQEKIHAVCQHPELEGLNETLQYQGVEYEASFKSVQSNPSCMGVIVFVQAQPAAETERNVEREREEAAAVSLELTLHNIQTPLQGILEMADRLSETPLNPQQKAMNDTILLCCESILSMLKSKP